jgi:ABC transporter substrate binding protein
MVGIPLARVEQLPDLFERGLQRIAIGAVVLRVRRHHIRAETFVLHRQRQPRTTVMSMPIMRPCNRHASALRHRVNALHVVERGAALHAETVDDPHLPGIMRPCDVEAAKRLQLLTEIAPGTKRVAIMFSPETALYVRSYFQPSFEAAAGLLQVEPIIAPVYSDAEIEMVITSLAREPGGGLITVPDNLVNSHRQTVISQAARNNIPAVYQISVFVRDGGLLSYGADDVDAYRRAAMVVERILRGEKPSDLPVQLPAKFEMAVNLKTAKALNLTIPETLLATADEVIQ